MGTGDSSTVGDRVAVVGQLLSRQGEYGVVTLLSRQAGVARQTLYTWRERGRAALEQAFAPPAAPSVGGGLERRILTLLVDGHAGERGIRRCLLEQGRTVSLGTISAVVTAAERRALRAMARPRAVGPRTVAFDEIYGNDRHGAYLSVVDARPLRVGAGWSGRRQVRWAWTPTAGPCCCGRPKRAGCAGR